MIIKFERIPDVPNLRLVEPTWRGDSGELVVPMELTKCLYKMWGDTPADVLTFELSAVPINGESYMFSKEGDPKSIGGCMYTNPIIGLHFVCELLLLYVGPEYPKHFYIRKHDA